MHIFRSPPFILHSYTSYYLIHILVICFVLKKAVHMFLEKALKMKGTLASATLHTHREIPRASTKRTKHTNRCQHCTYWSMSLMLSQLQRLMSSWMSLAWSPFEAEGEEGLAWCLGEALAKVSLCSSCSICSVPSMALLRHDIDCPCVLVAE